MMLSTFPHSNSSTNANTLTTQLVQSLMSGRNTLLRNTRFDRLATCLNKLIHVCVSIFIFTQICNPTSPHAIHVNLTSTPGHPAKNSHHKIVSKIRKIAHQCYTHYIIRHFQPCYHRTIAMSYLLKYTVSTSGAIM